MQISEISVQGPQSQSTSLIIYGTKCASSGRQSHEKHYKLTVTYFLPLNSKSALSLGSKLNLHKKIISWMFALCQ